MAPDPQSETPENEDSSPENGLDLESLRRQIDVIDRQLIDTLSERARVVVAIGAAKQHDGTPIYAPDRERRVLDTALGRNPGPLPDRTIEAIYRELMSGSFRLEQPLRVASLGPPGSFSHLAATRHFGTSVDHVTLASIGDAFDEVRAGRCTYGLVPFENSIGGGIPETLDAFLRYDVVPYAEALLEVRHAFLARCPIEAVRRVHSKPEIFVQCRRWLSRRLPDAELMPAASSAAAVQLAADEPDTAAIGSELAGRLYGVHAVETSIQDSPDNVTRFLVIARERAKPTGDDKTTVTFDTADRPGALVDVLASFQNADVNLSHIDKRPSGRRSFEYTFFVDADAHLDEPKLQTALTDARTHCLALKALGSYPRATRVL